MIHGNVNEWNKTTERITGFTKEEAIGKKLVNQFITDELQASVQNVLTNALLGNETANYSLDFTTPTVYIVSAVVHERG